MSTERLYYDDPFRLQFVSPVKAHSSWKDTASIVLERSAFYPEAGGQMADFGTLGGLTVRDVQVDDDGIVHHVVEGALPAIGTELEGRIDRDRRRLHMSLHTAQHMLSRALEDEASAATVSSRLGENGCTIDVNRNAIDEREIARAEDLVNRVIEDDLVIRSFFPTTEELSALPLRRKPKVTDNIRVVDIGGFDVTPCGGTHCLRTAQVGIVRVTGLEKYKGMIRVAFSAGRRARTELGEQSSLLQTLARDLTCGQSAIRNAVEKLRREATDAREALGTMRARVANSVATELLLDAEKRSDPFVISVLDREDVDFLRDVAARITKKTGVVALIGSSSEEGVSVVIARGAGSTFDCGAFLKRIAAETGGRGGGRPDRAEGRLPAGTAWIDVAQRARA